MMTPRPVHPDQVREAALRLRGFGINEASGGADTDASDPYGDAYHRGESAGLLTAEHEYRRGFEDGVLTALVCVVIGAALVVILAWWFTRG